MIVLSAVFAALAASLVMSPRARLVPPRPQRAARPLPVRTLAGGCAAVAALAILPMPLALPTAVAAAVFAWRLVGRLEPAAARRHRARLEATLPQVVDLMSTCLAAGSSPSGALPSLAAAIGPPMAGELSPFVARLGLGADPVTVWTAMSGHPQLGPLGRVLARSAQTGASVADALARLGTDLREQRRMAREARARTIEVKASAPLGLCLLPAFVLVGIVPVVAGSFSLASLGL